jgi:nucleoside-diphosphate-sugar epimerase
MNLVTGATGLLGSHIVEQLRKRDLPVRVLVRRGSDVAWLKTQGVEFAEGDITDRASLDRACQGCDVVYHSAARVGDWGPWDEFQRITIDGTQNVIDACVAARVRRLVHISSVSTYGYYTDPITVDETSASSSTSGPITAVPRSPPRSCAGRPTAPASSNSRSFARRGFTASATARPSPACTPW